MTRTMRGVMTDCIYEEASAEIFYGRKDPCKMRPHDVVKTSASREKTTKSENFLTNPEKMTGFP